ncbi:MAG: acetate--CoA ligase family protein [Dehalococcoidia bacterium]
MRIFEEIFHPRTVAVVGASDYDGFSQALMSTRLRDSLFLVNPAREELHGRRCYATILDIEDAVDYVVVAVPALRVPDVLRECIEKGVKAVHIFTAGFSETGIAERRALEEEVKEIARGKVRLIGPNCMGICCPKSGLTFIPDASTEEGSVGVISQSGTFGEQFLSVGKLRNLRFSKVISYGNALDLDCPDFLEYLAHDPETEVIALYMEGTRDGQRLKVTLADAASRKPVLALKGGVTEQGSRAACSHTGSLAGSPQVWSALFRQTGVLQVEDFDELLDGALALSCASLPAGRGTALVTNSGGFSVLETDLCTRAGLEVPQFTDETIAELRKMVPLAGTSTNNPLDAWPIYYNIPGTTGTLADVLKVLSRDRSIHSIVLHFDEVAYLRRVLGAELEGYLRDLIGLMIEGCRYARDEMRKTVMVCVALDAYSEDEEDRRQHLLAKKAFEDSGFPVYSSLGASIRALSVLYRYRSGLGSP